MNDERDLLERALHHFEPQPGLTERIYRRREQKRRKQRIRAGGLGLGIAIGVGWLGVNAIPSAPSIPADSPTPTATVSHGEPQPNGWVAFDSDGDIYLVRPGQDARRLEVAESDIADDSCPTWSPDGTWLSFGRLTGSSSDAELVIVAVGRDGAIGAPKVIALDGFQSLPGFDPHPCATWAPDGQWVAFVGSGEVWVANVHTGAIRRLPDLRPTDLEWRPGTDELAIAGDIGPNRAADTSSTPVTVYSVSTGELRQLGSVRAANLTWSPDGSTLAYQGGENDADELWLVDADGANERLLTHVGTANHGVGPVWSPTGERIAYQRLLSGTGERHEVVLVSVADGNETVIGPPETDGPNGPESWYPFSVTWSPDGTTLLYSAWSHVGDGPLGGTPSGVLAVRADTPTNVTVVTESSSLTGFVYDHSWVPTQMWGRQPE
jgi:Tol biopolymer transport system component